MDEPTGTVMQPTVDAIVVRDDSRLTHAAHAADEAARRTLFTDYLERISPHTRRRQAADLALFVRYLADAGVVAATAVPDQARALLDADAAQRLARHARRHRLAGHQLGHRLGLCALAAARRLRHRLDQCTPIYY